MEITKVPPNYASLRGPLVYTFSDTAPRTFDVRIFDANTDEIVGAKRLTGVARGSVDAAPYLRRRLYFLPRTGATGFVSALGRTVFASVEAGGVNSPRLFFVPTEQPIVPPMLLSTFPASRRIGRAECDELTLCTDTPCVIRVAAVKQGVELKTQTFTAPWTGVTLFRLNTADFPGADVLQLHIEGVRTLTYHFTDFRAGRRLAWRSSAGSIEHYTFPVEKEVSDEVEQECVLTQEGYRPVAIRSERRTTLLSAYEPEKVLGGLAEILTSPAVWSIDDGVYIPVVVHNTASGLRRCGTLRNLEVQIRHHPETFLP